MRNYFSNFIYLFAFAVYSFLTLPLLLPSVPIVDDFEKKDVVIVLGGGVNPDCTIGNSVQSRIETAIQLFQLGKVEKILFTGGPYGGSNRCVESFSMERYAGYRQIPKSRILKESRALNTYQNAFYATEQMRQKGMKSAYVVTSTFHTKRANFIFQQYDIDFQVVPALDASKGVNSYFALFKEQVILCFHSIFGIPEGFGLSAQDEELVAAINSRSNKG